MISVGKDRPGEEHSHGISSMLFKVLSRETSNGLFVIEHINMVNGGPPLHKHLNQEQYFYVIEGAVRFAVGEKRPHLRAGDSILGSQGIPHTFAAVEGKPSPMLIAFSPAGMMEQVQRETAVPNPTVQDAAILVASRDRVGARRHSQPSSSRLVVLTELST